MRRALSFGCDGATLAATLDEADSSTGLLIVSGGNEIRIGAHRGMAKLAADVATAGYPVFRFDRRGVGDSGGENGGFESSGPDIAAAIAAFREAAQVTRIVAFGNCDAASALVLHSCAVDALVLANIWAVESGDELPPPAAIKARYLEKLKDPKALLGLFTGKVNIRKLASGLSRIAAPAPAPASSFAERLAAGLEAFPGPVTILSADRDGTALAFAAEWRKPVFDKARARADVKLIAFDSSAHSFAADADYAVLNSALLEALA